MKKKYQILMSTQVAITPAQTEEIFIALGAPYIPAVTSGGSNERGLFDSEGEAADEIERILDEHKDLTMNKFKVVQVYVKKMY